MTKNEMIIINESNIEDKIYIIRGQEVMLDFDLAKIYGYTVKAFNQQVKNNINKFEKDFMFQLSKKDYETLSRSKNFTSIMQTKGKKGGRTSYPYAFTENGIYMLITVLKGSLATRQTIRLIKIFRKLKDGYIRGKKLNINGIEYVLIQQSQRIEKIEKDMVTKGELKNVVDEVNDINERICNNDITIPFIISNGHKYEMDKYFKSLFKEVNKSIIIIDNYISTKTLDLLTYLDRNIDISIYTSINTKSKDKLKEVEYLDFMCDNKDIKLNIYDSSNLIHDRFIIFDYKSNKQRIFTLGQSIKDTGNKISVITELNDINLSKELIDIIDSKSKYIW